MKKVYAKWAFESAHMARFGLLHLMKEETPISAGGDNAEDVNGEQWDTGYGFDNRTGCFKIHYEVLIGGRPGFTHSKGYWILTFTADAGDHGWLSPCQIPGALNPNEWHGQPTEDAFDFGVIDDPHES